MSTFTAAHHQHAAHCESGVVSTLLRVNGIDISEAMAFGLSGALAFAYLPMIKIAGMPLIAYRMPPGKIIKGLAKRLGLSFSRRRFSDADAGMAALDQALARGEVVGLQTSVYWLPYFPPDMRFHFNAHNLLVYGRDGDDYLISDPVFATPQRCPAADLRRARFAKGALAAKGQMYQLSQLPQQLDLASAVARSLVDAGRQLGGIPGIPFIGVRGIRYLARRIRRLEREPVEQARLFLGHIVRMQEEIGTGGAGFRFLYASFLDEAAERLQQPGLQQLSRQMTAVGDLWREFATTAVAFCKQRKRLSVDDVAASLELCAEAEAAMAAALRHYRP